MIRVKKASADRIWSIFTPANHLRSLSQVDKSLRWKSSNTQAQPEIPAVPLPTSSADFNEKFHFLQKSVIPTMHFQRSLPRLPIPKLEKTVERYLKAQQPLLSPEEHAKTATYAKDFLNKEGKELNELLLAGFRKMKHTSYISDLWFDMYLRSRLPLVLNYNPFIAMNDDPNKQKMDQAIRAADLTVSALRFRNSLNANLLEPDVYHMNPKKTDNETFRKVVSFLPEVVSWYGAYFYKAFPLDMSQYVRLFNSTRIPRQDKDELFTDKTARHVAVLCNGAFYTVDVVEKNGDIRSPKEIHLAYQPCPES
ncbi:Carnitine O-palmitoyltransferase 2, mitochondrial [Hypsibius exemplaris]|uniref:Carnitine O-palmitoyltransferase 2, mitochondrial n=1 Tax=Hypsibius exemplaris TaxID=2072580 RepID=A0A1W0X2J7_HYPEX|nr:Carnitine O-palmitoyltransferase 2, mitochondrial [Hypsibius exemplaris]